MLYRETKTYGKKMTAKHKRKFNNGYISLLVVIFMLVLMAASFRFLDRAALGVKIAGDARDSYESFLMAESSLNLLIGKFKNNLTSYKQQSIADKILGSKIQQNKNNPNRFLMPYMFYQSNGNGIDHNDSSLLQKIANSAYSKPEDINLSSQQIMVNTKKILLNQLYISNLAQPKTYVLNNQGLLIESNKSVWDNHNIISKSAVWFELTENKDDPLAVDITAQAVAKVDDAINYIQRFVGTYKSNNNLGDIALIQNLKGI